MKARSNILAIALALAPLTFFNVGVAHAALTASERAAKVDALKAKIKDALKNAKSESDAKAAIDKATEGEDISVIAGALQALSSDQSIPAVARSAVSTAASTAVAAAAAGGSTGATGGAGGTSSSNSGTPAGSPGFSTGSGAGAGGGGGGGSGYNNG